MPLWNHKNWTTLAARFCFKRALKTAIQVDAREVRQSIRRLGGVETEGGFAFRTAVQRAVVWEILGEKYGTRYVTDVRRHGGGHGRNA